MSCSHKDLKTTKFAKKLGEPVDYETMHKELEGKKLYFIIPRTENPPQIHQLLYSPLVVDNTLVAGGVVMDGVEVYRVLG